MTLTEKQQAALELLSSRQNIKQLGLTCSELDQIAERISTVSKEQKNSEDAAQIQEIINKINASGLGTPEVLEPLKAKLKEVGGSTQRRKAEPVEFKINGMTFTEAAQGRPSKEFQIQIDKYNTDNATDKKKKDFRV